MRVHVAQLALSGAQRRYDLRRVEGVERQSDVLADRVHRADEVVHRRRFDQADQAVEGAIERREQVGQGEALRDLDAHPLIS